MNDIKNENQIKKIYDACKKYEAAYNSKYTKFSKLGNWLDKESTIFYNESKRKKNKQLHYKRGQIIKVDFGVNVGSEVSNTHFAIILNDDDNSSTDTITVLPLTSKKRTKNVYLGNLISSISENDKYKGKTYGCITQIKTVSKKRILFNKRRKICNQEIFEIIDNALIKYLTKQE